MATQKKITGCMVILKHLHESVYIKGTYVSTYIQIRDSLWFPFQQSEQKDHVKLSAVKPF